MASVSKDFLLSALRHGFKDSQIAEALNVTQSAVSQLIDAHNLREEAARTSKFQSIDTKLNNLEELLVDKLEAQVKRSMVDLRPTELARMLQIVNSSKRRSMADNETASVTNAKLVQLNFPKQVELTFNFNAQNEIIDVNGRGMQTMQSAKLLDMQNQETLDDGKQQAGTAGTGETNSSAAELIKSEEEKFAKRTRISESKVAGQS